MLFCPSFTRSVRFLQADKLITRLQRVEHTATCCGVMTNSMRLSTGNVLVNVMASDAVFWWAAIFRREWRGRDGGGRREEGGERGLDVPPREDTNDDTELIGSELRASRSEN